VGEEEEEEDEDGEWSVESGWAVREREHRGSGGGRGEGETERNVRFKSPQMNIYIFHWITLSGRHNTREIEIYSINYFIERRHG